MSKHKLFIQDSSSPVNLNSSDSSISQSSKSNNPYTSEEGLSVKNNISAAASKSKKIKLDTDESEKKNSSVHLSPVPSTSKKTDDDFSDSASSTLSDHGFDDVVDSQFFSTNQKLPYTYQEDKMILEFVLKGQNIFRVSSLSLWKYLESKKVKPKRTYQSLKNRFLRNIKPNIFSTYGHLIDNKDTVEKILIKFPELKKEMNDKKWHKEIMNCKVEKKPPKLNSNLNKFEINTEDTHSTPVTERKSVNVEHSPTIVATPVTQSPKTSNTERRVTLHKNLIQVTINFNVSNIPFLSMPSLSERFGKLKNKNEQRVPCPTCGRFYFRTGSNDSSESAGENDIPNSNPVERDESSPVISSVFSVANSSPKNAKSKIILSSWSSPKSSSGQILQSILEKSDKSNANSEETNSLVEDDGNKEDFEVEILEMPIKERHSETEDKTTDNDSDIDLIYEHTVERFQKLIEGDEEKVFQKKCLNKDAAELIDSNMAADKNLDSFFLEESSTEEAEAETCTPQPEAGILTRTQSQRVTRSSRLASNMMKMLEDSQSLQRRRRRRK